MDEGQNSSSKLLIAFLWFVSITIVGIVSYLLGTNNPVKVEKQPIATNITPLPTQIGAPTAKPGIATDLQSICEKTGPTQKKDYLRSYIIKEGDTINSIAENELGSTTRNTEITILNDNLKNLTVGSILYLPPENIKQSSGYIYEVSGKIIKKDEASWQLSYGGGEKGPGILFPGFWFKDIENVNDFKVGDCVTVLFDNGVKVYSVIKTR